MVPLVPLPGVEGKVRVTADGNTTLGRMSDHIEKARVHHGFAKALEMQLRETRKLINERHEAVERHEGGRAVTGPIRAQIHRTHETGQVTLTDGLDLHECRKIRHRKFGPFAGSDWRMCKCRAITRAARCRQGEIIGPEMNGNA